MNRIAAVTKDTVCLIVRTGVDTLPLCHVPAERLVGALTKRYGQPLPIGATPGGVALLSGYSFAQVRALLKRNEADSMRRDRVDVATITKAVNDCRRDGYAICTNYALHGLSGIAVPICIKGCLPFLALSNISTTDRIIGPRKQMIVDPLQRETADLVDLLAQSRVSAFL